MSVPVSKNGDKTLSSDPRNHAVKAFPIKRGDRFSTKVEGGYRSRPMPNDGVVVEDADGTQIYVPSNLLVQIGWSAPHE
jgi:hypothetical protein